MLPIGREPENATKDKYELIIVGGGIHGVMLLLEASRRDIKCLLLERGDFGAATSFNSLRILHGGLRSLQSIDLKRFFESVRARRWFLRTFPNLTKPLPCLMPLYSRGIKRPDVFRLALSLNDMLSRTRNQDVHDSNYLPNGRILSVSEVEKIVPLVTPDGLTGGAEWHDACVPDSHRVIIESLRWAVGCGGRAINYVEVDNLLEKNGRVVGVTASDEVSGNRLEFRGERVVNATGPWVRITARHFDRDVPKLFTPSVAWNVLFDYRAPFKHALAVTPPRPGAQTYFLHPWKGMVLAGTGHVPAASVKDDVCPDNQQLSNFVNDIDQALPSMKLGGAPVRRVFAGYLPARTGHGAQLTTREEIIDHRFLGGTSGLYSVCGIKFTTARAVALKVLKVMQLLGRNVPRSAAPPQMENLQEKFERAYDEGFNSSGWRVLLVDMAHTESVVNLADLVFRRVNLIHRPVQAMRVARELSSQLGWSAERQACELKKVAAVLK